MTKKKADQTDVEIYQKVYQGEEMAPGEVKYIARVKLVLNRGRLSVEPGTVIILGAGDKAQGINIDLLVKNGSVVLYESEEQAEQIKIWWQTEGKIQRAAVKSTASRRK